MSPTPSRRAPSRAPKAVSSASSMETMESLQVHSDGSSPLLMPAQAPGQVLVDPASVTTRGGVKRAPQQPTSSQAQPVPPSVPLIPRPPNLQLGPSSRAILPAMTPNANTVPEFLYQLTKMLTDNNRDIIEWSNGKFSLTPLPTIL